MYLVSVFLPSSFFLFLLMCLDDLLEVFSSDLDAFIEGVDGCIANLLLRLGIGESVFAGEVQHRRGQDR